jgi:hypothetical protein
MGLALLAVSDEDRELDADKEFVAMAMAEPKSKVQKQVLIPLGYTTFCFNVR